MRYLAVLAAILVAALLVWFFDRGPAERRAGRVVAKSDSSADGSSASEPRAAPAAASTQRGRLVYRDGAPAAAVLLHLAVGRPLETRVFRNRDYPPKTIWLVTHRRSVRTAADGGFSFPPVAGPAGGRAVLYTEPESNAFVLAEWLHQGDVVATRRVKVTGVLLGAGGVPLEGYVLGAQLGQPETWNNHRKNKETASFVSAQGDLGVDAHAKRETVTGDGGAFELRLVPGRNTFYFGEQRREGTVEIDVPAHDLDVRELRVPPPSAPEATTPGTLHGLVLDHAGRPHPRAEVRVWAGTVGDASHIVRCDAAGQWSAGGLRSTQAIAWAVGTGGRHIVLPSQSSGTVLLPCNTPITLRLPAPEEYCRVRPAGIDGFFLFERDRVFVGGDALDASDTVRMPPGPYRILVVTPAGRILDGAFDAPVGGTRPLLASYFRDTTQD